MAFLQPLKPPILYVGSKRIKLYIKYADGGSWKVTDFEFLEGKAFNESNFKMETWLP